MTRIAYASTILLAILCMSSVSFAQVVVFQDDFNAENGGAGAFNYSGFANWTVSDGSVDLLGNGFFNFYPNDGLYVELDGTSTDAGVLTSDAILVSPGTYLLEFDLGINGNTLSESMNVTLGGDYAETFDATDAGASPTFNLISRQIQVAAAGSVSIVFDHAGGDNFGLMIDNVSLTRLVPEPASVVLMGFCSLAILRNQRGRRGPRGRRSMQLA